MNGKATRTTFIDVSVGLSPSTPLWPGARRFELAQTRTEIGGGEVMTGSFFSMTPHCGTHIDAPLHFADGGKAIDAVNLDLLVGPCRVWEYAGDKHIAKGDLLAMGFVAEKRILIKTRNSASLRKGLFDENYISFLPDAIDHFVRSGVKLLGIDGFSIGPPGELTNRNHVTFCRAGGAIIEVLDLSDVEAGRYHLIALPIKLKGVEAAPARVLLLRPEDVDRVFGCSYIESG